MDKATSTPLAPDERFPPHRTEAAHDMLRAGNASFHFDFFPLPLLVLNACRQIVLCNQAFLDMTGAQAPDVFLGRRLGETLGCVYSGAGQGGCGTSEHCRQCGALRATLDGLRTGERTQQDCQLIVKGAEGTSARDLRVFVAPWPMGQERYVVATFVDIAHEQRRRVLERLFFHDILNAAGGAKGLIELLFDEVPEHTRETVGLVRASLFGLVEEIQKQRQLLALESGEYVASAVTLQGLEVLRALAREYAAHPLAQGKAIQVDKASENVAVLADYTLLKRVIVNMLMNALEASPAGGAVVAGLRREKRQAVFWVMNEKAMPEEVKLQVFKRSFSTKGQGRGLGTYSIKLLTENYLGGEAGFSSDDSGGTTFWVRLPWAEMLGP